jgi:hypothetical protein
MKSDICSGTSGVIDMTDKELHGRGYCKCHLERTKERLTHAEYLELPEVKAQDEKEMAYMAEMRARWKRILPAQGVGAQLQGTQAMKDFRQEILEAVWEHTGVGNAPRGEWMPEYFIPRGHEKEVDEAIDAAAARLLRRLGR